MANITTTLITKIEQYDELLGSGKVSYDVREPDGTPCGLLSYNLRKTLEQFGYNCTIEQLLTNIKKGFGTNDQTPVLSVNSNTYGPNTIIFEKKIKTSRTYTKPTITQLNSIKQTNNQIKIFSDDFNGFTNNSRNMTQNQIKTKLDSFVLKLEEIKSDLKK